MLNKFFSGQFWVEKAAVTFIFTSVLQRSMWKYDHSRAYRVIMLDAGHIGQTFHLVSTALGLRFDANPYSNFDKILSNRLPNGTNRVRALLYAGNESFASKPFDVKVGVKIISYEKLPNILAFNAVIDQIIVDNFHFAPKIALFKDEHFNGLKTFEAKSYASDPEIVIDSADQYTTSNLVYDVNPADTINHKVYRSDIQSLRDALKSLQELKQIKRP